MISVDVVLSTQQHNEWLSFCILWTHQEETEHEER